MKLLDAAVKVLEDAGVPLRTEDMIARILAQGFWQTEGLTPKDTLDARLAVDIKTLGSQSRFQRTAKGVFALRRWGLPEFSRAGTVSVSSSAADSASSSASPSPSVPESAPPASKTAVATVASSPLSSVPNTSASADQKSLLAQYSFPDAAAYVLEHYAGQQPMHYRAITAHALTLGLRTQGQTPEATLFSKIGTEIDRQTALGQTPRFVKHGRGMIGLSAWLPQGLVAQIEHHNRTVRQALHARLAAMDPTAFESLIGELLVALGFADVEVTARSGDGGIDVRGTLVVGGAIQIHMAVQVKRWKGNIQAPIVQQVRGSLGTHDQGLIITTSDFSDGARKEAARANAVPMGLMNGTQLVALLVEHEIGVQRQPYSLIELDMPGAG